MARKGKKQTAPVNDGPYYVMSDSDQTPTMHYIYYEGKGDMNYAPSESYDEIASDVAYLNEAYKRDEMRNSDQGNEGKTMATRNYDSNDVRRFLDNAHKRAQIIDGWVKVSYRKDGYRVVTVNNDGTYESDSQPMTRQEAYKELYYLLLD